MFCPRLYDGLRRESQRKNMRKPPKAELTTDDFRSTWRAGRPRRRNNQKTHCSFEAYTSAGQSPGRGLLAAGAEACSPSFAASHSLHMRFVFVSTVTRCWPELNQWSMGTSARRMAR